MRRKPDPIHAGQESVWQFPGPAVAEPTAAHNVIEHRGHRIADSCRTVRTLETSHPPSYYIPREDIAPGVLRLAEGSSFCEWKGAAVYWDVAIDRTVIERVGWCYPSPTASFDPERPCRLLRPPVRLLSRRRADRDAAGGRLLRRLDHGAVRGPVQGWAGKHGMVER